MAKVLVLGAGMIARPLVQYLLDQGYFLTVADISEENAQFVIQGSNHAQAVQFDINDDPLLQDLILNHNIVVSLLPAIYHVKVARQCIRYKKNMITASYVSPEMSLLDKEAKKAGIMLVNELGLDPGIDHMSAKKIIDDVHENGGKIEEFYSFCGALPAPESANNPFKYKFSWSPRGVLLAGKNSARYKWNGKIVITENKDLFRDLRYIDFKGIGKFEVYPNRDSLQYIDLYGMPEVKTVLRGTIRYKGWSDILDTMVRINLLSQEEIELSDKTYAGLISKLIGETTSTDIKKKLAKYLALPESSNIIKAYDWLGLLKSKPLNKIKTNPFDMLFDLMLDKMMISANDRDMVLMLHIFKVIDILGKSHFIVSRMSDFGTLETDTATARTVALPAAIGTKLILEKKIDLSGVCIPVMKQIYQPILADLAKFGIKLEEEYRQIYVFKS